MEAVNGVAEGPPPPSPLTGCYLLVVLGEPHTASHKDIILQRLAKGLLSWNVNDCLVDLEKELAVVTEQGLEGEEARYGERLIQYASENLVTEILIHPSVSTLAQCVRNLLSSFTRHRHIIHAGYTFAANGSWILQDGTFSLVDFSEAFQEIDVQRVIRAYENGISLDLHCSSEGDWSKLPKDSFSRGCKLRVNPDDVLDSGSLAIANFVKYIAPFLVPAELQNTLESSDVVGNIRFSRPTLYVFPGGQGDAALFGINGFNMLVDGGFSRKACFWDFVRHLDRLDAVMLTRLNNSNACGIGAVMRRKAQNAVYPQIGHFFSNIQSRKVNLSPDGDKDKDPLLINLLEEGQELISNLRSLDLTPQVCYRDSEPINLYHKVGHGTLDMYVLNPAKESREVREFLLRWNNSDQKLFANHKFSKDCMLPLQNIVSICALLVWRPANPNDTITRILFPGSTPQTKIFEGLDKLRNVECIKHITCTEKTLTPPHKYKSKETIIDKFASLDKPKIESKKIKPRPIPENKVTENNIKNVVENGHTEKQVKKSESIESDKSDPRQIRTKKEELIEKEKSPPKPKPETNGYKPKQKPEKKQTPATPKKISESRKIDTDNQRTRSKISPSATPAKSTKDANNRKVIESKVKSASKKEPKQPEKKEEAKKVERKPISRRTKNETKLPESPVKRAINGVHKPDSISRKSKLDKDGTTDSSTVSTPSADQEALHKKDISKLTPDELQQLKAHELAELKEEQEAIKELEAVFRKGDQQIDEPPTDLRKIKDTEEDKTEPEEYLIVETEELKKEEETVKLAKDSEESEKKKDETEQEESGIGEQETDLGEGEIPSLDDNKKDDEIKEPADEKVSANIESGATTTAPTLPEDERIPLNEIKEDVADQIEEKHVKEDTKEKESKEEIPAIPALPSAKTGKLPPVVGIRLDKETRIRDIVKTPDEVADLPVHEEADVEQVDLISPTDVDAKLSSRKSSVVHDAEEKVDSKQPSRKASVAHGAEVTKEETIEIIEEKKERSRKSSVIQDDELKKDAIVETKPSSRKSSVDDQLKKEDTIETKQLSRKSSVALDTEAKLTDEKEEVETEHPSRKSSIIHETKTPSRKSSVAILEGKEEMDTKPSSRKSSLLHDKEETDKILEKIGDTKTPSRKSSLIHDEDTLEKKEDIKLPSRKSSLIHDKEESEEIHEEKEDTKLPSRKSSLIDDKETAEKKEDIKPPSRKSSLIHDKDETDEILEKEEDTKVPSRKSSLTHDKEIIEKKDDSKSPSRKSSIISDKDVKKEEIVGIIEDKEEKPDTQPPSRKSSLIPDREVKKEGTDEMLEKTEQKVEAKPPSRKSSLISDKEVKKEEAEEILLTIVDSKPASRKSSVIHELELKKEETVESIEKVDIKSPSRKSSIIHDTAGKKDEILEVSKEKEEEKETKQESRKSSLIQDESKEPKKQENEVDIKTPSRKSSIVDQEVKKDEVEEHTKLPSRKSSVIHEADADKEHKVEISQTSSRKSSLVDSNERKEEEKIEIFEGKETKVESKEPSRKSSVDLGVELKEEKLHEEKQPSRKSSVVHDTNAQDTIEEKEEIVTKPPSRKSSVIQDIQEAGEDEIPDRKLSIADDKVDTKISSRKSSLVQDIQETNVTETSERKASIVHEDQTKVPSRKSSIVHEAELKETISESKVQEDDSKTKSPDLVKPLEPALKEAETKDIFDTPSPSKDEKPAEQTLETPKKDDQAMKPVEKSRTPSPKKEEKRDSIIGSEDAGSRKQSIADTKEKSRTPSPQKVEDKTTAEKGSFRKPSLSVADEKSRSPSPKQDEGIGEETEDLEDENLEDSGKSKTPSPSKETQATASNVSRKTSVADVEQKLKQEESIPGLKEDDKVEESSRKASLVANAESKIKDQDEALKSPSSSRKTSIVKEDGVQKIDSRKTSLALEEKESSLSTMKSRSPSPKAVIEDNIDVRKASVTDKTVTSSVSDKVLDVDSRKSSIATNEVVIKSGSPSPTLLKEVNEVGEKITSSRRESTGTEKSSSPLPPKDSTEKLDDQKTTPRKSSPIPDESGSEKVIEKSLSPKPVNGVTEDSDNRKLSIAEIKEDEAKSPSPTQTTEGRRESSTAVNGKTDDHVEERSDLGKTGITESKDEKPKSPSKIIEEKTEESIESSRKFSIADAREVTDKSKSPSPTKTDDQLSRKSSIVPGDKPDVIEKHSDSRKVSITEAHPSSTISEDKIEKSVVDSRKSSVALDETLAESKSPSPTAINVEEGIEPRKASIVTEGKSTSRKSSVVEAAASTETASSSKNEDEGEKTSEKVDSEKPVTVTKEPQRKHSVYEMEGEFKLAETENKETGSGKKQMEDISTFDDLGRHIENELCCDSDTEPTSLSHKESIDDKNLDEVCDLVQKESVESMKKEPLTHQIAKSADADSEEEKKDATEKEVADDKKEPDNETSIQSKDINLNQNITSQITDKPDKTHQEVTQHVNDFLNQERIHTHQEIDDAKVPAKENITPKKMDEKPKQSKDEEISEKDEESSKVEKWTEEAKEKDYIVKTEKIQIDLTDKPEHAESVVLKSTPESPIVNIVPPLPVLPTDIDKVELGRKSPKEREQDVAKIVASVATVLKSDAPLEEFQGQIPLATNTPYGAYTTELRETHITTCDSPSVEEKTIEPKRLSDLESSIIVEETEDQKKSELDQDDAGTVHRMLVTASSEDGGEETEICPAGTITFSKSSESSGRSSPENLSRKLSQSSSILDTVSDQTTVREPSETCVKSSATVLDAAAPKIYPKLDVKEEEDKSQTEISEILSEAVKEISGEAASIKDNIFSTFSKIGQTLTEAVETTLEQKVEDVKRGIESKEQDIVEALKEKKESAEHYVAGHLKDSLSTIEKALDSTDKAKETLVKGGESTLTKISDPLKETISGVIGGLKEDNVKAVVEESHDKLYPSLKDDLDDNYSKKPIESTSSSLDTIVSSVEDMSQSLQDSTKSIAGSIEEKVDTKKDALVNKLENQAAQLINSYTDEFQDTADKSRDFKNEIEKAEEELKSTLRTAMESCENKVQEGVDISSIVKEEIDKSLETLEKAKDESKEVVSDIQGEVAKKTDSVLEEAKQGTEDVVASVKETVKSALTDVKSGVEKEKEELKTITKDIETAVTDTKDHIKAELVEKQAEIADKAHDVHKAVVDKADETAELLKTGLTTVKQELDDKKQAVVDKADETAELLKTELTTVKQELDDKKQAVVDKADETAELLKTGLTTVKQELDDKKQALLDTKAEIQEDLQQKKDSVAKAIQDKKAEVEHVVADTKEKLQSGLVGIQDELAKEKEVLAKDLHEAKEEIVHVLADTKENIERGLEKEKEAVLSTGKEIKSAVDDVLDTGKKLFGGLFGSKKEKDSSATCDIRKDEVKDKLDVAPSQEKKLSISDVEIMIDDKSKEKHITDVPKVDPMSMSFYGALPDEGDDPMTSSCFGELPGAKDDKDPIASWGKPLGLPSPAPPNERGTPKKERRLPSNVMAKNKLNDDKARSESPSKIKKKINPVYVDLTYVPYHGNSNYAYVDFFKRVRARYYVFSGIEPSREVYNALLEAKQTWEDKDAEVTIIPTYDTDVLGYWVAENEELLAKHKIDLSPSASRCTINLQDHETSCSAYRLEF